MLKKVTITNYLGESVEYKIEGVDVNDNNGLLITGIKGLGPVKAGINMTKLATADGGIYNSARLSTRNIVINARFTNATSIEEARLMSYKFFPIKKKVTFTIETDNRIAVTEGYVESNEPNPFKKEEDVQISIICESPFFLAPEKDITLFSGVDSIFEFPFENAVEMTETTVEHIDVPITEELLNSCGDVLELVNSVPGDMYWEVREGKELFFKWHESDTYDSVAEIYETSPGVVSIEGAGVGYEDIVLGTTHGCLKYETVAPSPETAKSIEFGEIVLKKFSNVHYSGDSQIGCTIELHFIGEVTQNVTIYNLYTRERMVIDLARLSAIIGSTIVAGDSITICTVEGNKSITFTRGAVVRNILNALDKNTDWLVLSKGDNVIGFVADELEQENIKITIISQVAYEGV